MDLLTFGCLVVAATIIPTSSPRSFILVSSSSSAKRIISFDPWGVYPVSSRLSFFSSEIVKTGIPLSSTLPTCVENDFGSLPSLFPVVGIVGWRPNGPGADRPCFSVVVLFIIILPPNPEVFKKARTTERISA